MSAPDRSSPLSELLAHLRHPPHTRLFAAGAILGAAIALAAMLGIGGCATVAEPLPVATTPAERSTQLLGWRENREAAVDAAQYLSRHATTDPAETLALIRVLEAPGDPQILLREFAARALGLAGDPRAVPALTRRLNEDPDEYVRRSAANSLGTIGSTEAIPALLARLLDRTEDHWVTTAAATALGEIGDPSVIWVLEEFETRDSDYWCETVAIEAALTRLRAIRDGSADETD